MRKLGRVIEVYLPVDEELTKVGFKIQIEDQIINIIENQNINNSKIHRDDFVFVDIINNDNQIVYNVELVNNDLELEEEIDE